MKERIVQEIILMLKHQTNLNWIDRVVFGYEYGKLFNEIIKDMKK